MCRHDSKPAPRGRFGVRAWSARFVSCLAAAAYQEMAAKHADDDDMGADIKATLKKYQDELAKAGG